MESTGIVPTMPIGGDTGGFGTSGIWLFAILALLWGGNGFGGSRSNAATVEDITNSASFTRLESEVQANGTATERKTDAIINGISSIGYEMANKIGETNALVISENQKTRDMISQNKIEQLQAQVNQLQLQQALAGVVRYPSAITYNGGTSPFCPSCTSQI